MSDTMPRSGYEFSTQQNHLIGHLARKMTQVGTFLAVVGVLSLVTAVAGWFSGFRGWILLPVFVGAFFLATGLWTVRGGRSFRRVTTTQGDDIDCVMRALRELDHFYTLNFWLVLLWTAILVTTVLGSPPSLY